MSAQQRPRRLCRTPDEAFQAGWEDGAHDPPMTPEQQRRLVALLRPYRDVLTRRAS